MSCREEKLSWTDISIRSKSSAMAPAPARLSALPEARPANQLLQMKMSSVTCTCKSQIQVASLGEHNSAKRRNLI